MPLGAKLALPTVFLVLMMLPSTSRADVLPINQTVKHFDIGGGPYIVALTKFGVGIRGQIGFSPADPVSIELSYSAYARFVMNHGETGHGPHISLKLFAIRPLYVSVGMGIRFYEYSVGGEGWGMPPDDYWEDYTYEVDQATVLIHSLSIGGKFYLADSVYIDVTYLSLTWRLYDLEAVHEKYDGPTDELLERSVTTNKRSDNLFEWIICSVTFGFEF